MHPKQLWNAWSTHELPFLPCPHCKTGTLVRVRETYKEEETRASKAKHSDEGWTPGDEQNRFSTLMKCRSCSDVVAVVGVSGQEQEYYQDSEGDYDSEWVEVFSPRHFLPAPPVFQVIKECPKAVLVHLERAFGLVWSDHQACANALRAAVEALLDAQGVGKTKINKQQKRVSRTTHDRLETFKEKHPDAGGYLMAIKWLGNAGSHGADHTPKRDVLLQGFELFEQALNDLYSAARVKQLKKIAKEITTRKGKPKRVRF